MLCAKTLYNYMYMGLIDILALDCPLIVERKTSDITATVENWLQNVISLTGSAYVCKTIIAANGSEFAEIVKHESNWLNMYYAHPYSPWEHGSNERHNGLLRPFIPKGCQIHTVDNAKLHRIMHCVMHFQERFSVTKVL